MTGLGLYRPLAVTLASKSAMQREYERAEYACTFRGFRADACTLRAAADYARTETATAEGRFGAVCAFMGALGSLDVRNSDLVILKDIPEGRVYRISLRVFPDEPEPELDFVLKIADADVVHRGFENKIYKDRLVSVACVNFIAFSRGVHEFWSLGYGGLQCRGGRLRSGGPLLLDADTTCLPDGVRGRGDALVSVQSYIPDSVTLSDFCREVAAGRAPSEALVTIFALVFLNLQVALESCLFTHGDLHTGNVMVRETPEEETYSVLYASTVYSFRTRYVPVIIDYDFAVSSLPYAFDKTLVGWLNEDAFMFGNFQPPGLDALVLMSVAKLQLADRTDFQKSVIDRVLGTNSYSGRDVLIRYLLNKPANRWSLPEALGWRCDSPNAFMFSHPIDFARNLMAHMPRSALTEAPAREYVSPYSRCPGSSVEFWNSPDTLDALRRIWKNRASVGTYLDSLTRDIQSMGNGRSTEDIISRFLGSASSARRAEPTRSALDAWDDYFLLRYLQLDVQNCPHLLDALPLFLANMCVWAEEVASDAHSALFRVAFDAAMYRKYTLEKQELIIE